MVKKKIKNKIYEIIIIIRIYIGAITDNPELVIFVIIVGFSLKCINIFIFNNNIFFLKKKKVDYFVTSMEQKS